LRWVIGCSDWSDYQAVAWDSGRVPRFHRLAADGAFEATELSLVSHVFGTAIKRTALAAPLVLLSHGVNMRLKSFLCQPPRSRHNQTQTDPRAPGTCALGAEKKESTDLRLQPSLPAVRLAIVDLILRPPSQRCSHCRRRIREKPQLINLPK